MLLFTIALILFMFAIVGANHLGYREREKEGITKGREQVHEELRKSGRYFDGKA